jgi:hypothetical protein
VTENYFEMVCGHKQLRIDLPVACDLVINLPNDAEREQDNRGDTKRVAEGY